MIEEASNDVQVLVPAQNKLTVTPGAAGGEIREVSGIPRLLVSQGESQQR